LVSFGFEVKSQAGSHIKVVIESPYFVRPIIVPNDGSVSKGTLHGIYKGACLYVPERADELKDFFYTKES